MNGAVFQTSAMTTAQKEAPVSASQRTCWPRIRLATPASSKISFHISAETMVGMAHGTRMPARTTPRPLKALDMISAIATPRIVSRSDADDRDHGGVEERVVEPVHRAEVALHRIVAGEDAGEVVSPTNCSPAVMIRVFGSGVSLTWKNDSRIDITTGMPATIKMTARLGRARSRPGSLGRRSEHFSCACARPPGPGETYRQQW